VRELLSNYGKIWEVWFDGACGDGDERCKKMKYYWDGIYSTVRELQPDAVMFNNDLRWVGNEAGDARDSEWSVVPEGFDAMAQDIGSRKKLIEAAKRGETLRWRPAETDTSIRPGWFYHKFDDFSVKSAEKLIDIYFDAVGGNSVLLLNVPPDTRGLINANDIKALNKVRRTLDSIFKVNFISGAKATASSEDGTNKAALAADGDIDTSWRPAGADASPWIEFDLGAERTFNVAMLQEDIKQGQRVEEFLLEAWNGKNWIPVEISTTIGYKRLLRFDDVKAEKVRVSFTKLRGTPSLAETGLFYYEKKK
jgi:alpha-L-fucosidase